MSECDYLIVSIMVKAQKENKGLRKENEVLKKENETLLRMPKECKYGKALTLCVDAIRFAQGQAKQTVAHLKDKQMSEKTFRQFMETGLNTIKSCGNKALKTAEPLVKK